VSDTPCHAVAAWVAQSVRGSNTARSKSFFFSPKRPDRHWAHQDSSGVGTGGRSTAVMWPGRKAEKSPTPSIEDKDGWSLELSWAVAPQRKENVSFLCRLIQLGTPWNVWNAVHAVSLRTAYQPGDLLETCIERTTVALLQVST